MPPTLHVDVGPLMYYFTEAISTDHGSARAHTCPQCMRGLPCDPSSLSSLVGAVASQSHHRTDEEWKRGAFRSQADGSWDANGSPVYDEDINAS